MIKKSLTDGLVQLAIVLSLLRTDLVDNYLNSYYNRYPEIQEIVLGSSSAYTQTHFHNINWQNRPYSGHGYHKAIDNYDLNDVFRELRSLGSDARYRRLDTDVTTWLISNPPTPLVSDTASGVTVVPTHGVTGHSEEQLNLNSAVAHSDLEASGSSSSQEGASPDISSDNPFEVYLGDELTKEDMDLIEVLWRQDMDLGVGREMFDVNLRKELEKEQELELQKKREQEKEIELLQEKLAEEEASHNTDVTNYIIDNETGELIPVPATGELVPASVSVSESTDQLDDSDEGLSIEEAMRILEEQEAAPVTPLGTHNPAINTTDLIQNQESTNQSVDGNLSVNQNQTDQIQQNYQRQNSFEQRWQDIATILNLPPINSYLSNNFSFPEHAENTAYQNVSINPTSNSLDIHNDSSVLQGNVSFAAEVNSPDANSSLFNLDSQEFMFPPNGINTQPDSYNQSSALLQELLSDDMPSLELPELEDGLHMIDDTSSDSAVSSMDSIESPIQDVSEISDSVSVNSFMDGSSTQMQSSFDGIEGASGGDYEPTCNKYIKYEKFDMDQNDDGMYSDFSFPEDVLLNQSSSSNDSDVDYKPANLRHVNHNHTYPLQPGQQPKEPYNKPKKENKDRGKSRDEMRAKMMKVPLTIDQIINSPVEEFNELLQKYTMTEPQLQLIRDIRRRGKNKVAAQNCRKRKMDVLTNLEDEVGGMMSERGKLMKERRQLEQEMNEMRGKFQHLYKEVFQSLRDDNGQPYDPSQYSLQQSSDGNVFLVPRNSTTSDSVTKEKSTKKKSYGK